MHTVNVHHSLYYKQVQKLYMQQVSKLKLLEVGVGIKTVQVVSQALVAEDVLLLWGKII